MARLRSVAFIGVDGSGKTTQARILRDYLRRNGALVVEAHPYGRKLLIFIPGTARSGTGLHQTTTTSIGPFARLRALVEMFDIWLYAWSQHLRGRVSAYRSSQPCWLVSDRSFDDVLAKHLRLGTLPRSLLRGIRRFSPPVDTTVWLRVQPRIAFERDGDFDPLYYERMDTAYEQLSRWTEFSIVSTSNGGREEAARRIRDLLHIDEPPYVSGIELGGGVPQEKW